MILNKHISPLLLLLAAPLVLLSPVFLPGKALFWGTVSLQFVPWWVQAANMLQAGDLPLWNAASGMGAPLLANYQTGLFYPPNWVFMLLYLVSGIQTAVWWLAVLVALHLAWAGYGMACLGRDLGLNKFAQATSGLAFGLSLYLVGRAGFFSITFAVAWLPWIIVWSTRVLRSTYRSDPRWLRPWLGLVFAVGMQLLTGHAQTAWYTWLLTGLWAAGVCVPRWMAVQEPGSQTLKLLTRAGLRLAGAFGFAILLCSIQLIPTAEYLLQSQRSNQVGYDTAMTYSFWPWRFLTLLAPEMFGSPVSGDFWGYANYWEDAVYVGILPLILAVSLVPGLFQKQKRTGGAASGSRLLQDRAVVFSAAIIVTGFVLALGKNTPVFPWLYRNIPSFDLFQAPTRFTIWVVFGLALTAGIGMDRWRRPEKRALYWSRLATAGAFAVMLGAGLTAAALGQISPTFLRATALMGLFGMGAGLLNLLAPQGGEVPAVSKASSLWGWGCILFISIDLLRAGWGLNPAIGVDYYAPRDPSEGQAAGMQGRIYLSPESEYDLKYERFMRFDTFTPVEPWVNLRRAVLPNLNLLDGIASTNNYDPLVPQRYATWMEALPGFPAQIQQQLLNLMGVTGVEKVSLAEIAGVSFFANDGQRIRWVGCELWSRSAEDAWRQVTSGAVDFSRFVILEGDQFQVASECPQRVPGATMVVTADASHRLVVELESPAAGWLAVADTWYPGWVASLDGKPLEILRANYLFKAIHVPEGRHVVEFSYRPVSFISGAVASILAWMVFVFLYFRNFSVPRKQDDQ